MQICSSRNIKGKRSLCILFYGADFISKLKFPDNSPNWQIKKYPRQNCSELIYKFSLYDKYKKIMSEGGYNWKVLLQGTELWCAVDTDLAVLCNFGLYLSLAVSYLNLIQKKKENREKALITFVEGLEDRTPEIRSGACAALAILEVKV